MSDYRTQANQIREMLGLSHSPIAITFCDDVPEGISNYGGTYPEPTADGRTGAVAAGCVFWTEASTETFVTIPADHANCSVGSLTHGLISLDEAATKADVAAVCEAKWVDPEIFPHIPTVQKKYSAIVYGPLAETALEPDIVLLRLNAKQAMQLHSALPSIRFEGKPQCHIVPISLEQNEAAISVGCMLSRVRTGFSNSEMTCTIPYEQISNLVDALHAVCSADRSVAAYASQDAARFR